MVVREQTWHDDVAALDVPQTARRESFAGRRRSRVAQEGFGLGARRIDEGAGSHFAPHSVDTLQSGGPALLVAPCGHPRCAREDLGAVRPRVDRVEDDQAGVSAIGIDEALAVSRFWRHPGGMGAKVHGARAGRTSRRARWSYRKSPARTIQAGRIEAS